MLYLYGPIALGAAAVLTIARLIAPLAAIFADHAHREQNGGGILRQSFEVFDCSALPSSWLAECERQRDGCFF